uniref:NodB homology domain-containing protein n=1 Tax=Plasmodiophora brassicae TaxID=37360 RepID=A8E085_PLABS|nr:hypothetical protein [Plasmodiophora brassicae]
MTWSVAVALFSLALAVSAVDGARGRRPRSVSQVQTTVNGLSTFNWCGKRNMVALTFDGGFSLETVDLLVDLKRLGIKATFFLSGPADEGDCDVLSMITRDGHDIEHHSWSHPYLTKVSLDQFDEEITKMEDHVYNVCGVRNRKMTLFRPPFGDFNRELTLRVNRQGYTAASWTFDTEDYNGGNVESVFKAAVEKSKRLPRGSSAVILHHDFTYSEQGIKGIVDMYKSFFRGYQFVTARECYEACLADGDCQAPIDNWPGVFDY